MVKLELLPTGVSDLGDLAHEEGAAQGRVCSWSSGISCPDPGPCIWAGAARAPRAYHSLGCSLSMGQVIQVRDSRGEELQLHHESWRIHAPSVLVSVLTIEVVCCLKGVSWYPGIGRGSRRGCAGENQRLKAARSVTSMTLQILGQDPPVRLSTWGHSAVSPLFWLSLLGVCCRPPWVARAPRGPLVLP